MPKNKGVYSSKENFRAWEMFEKNLKRSLIYFRGIKKCIKNILRTVALY